MEDLFAHPPLDVSVIWHPAFPEGQALATRLFQRFRGEAFAGVSRCAGIPVSFRSEPAVGETAPPSIPLPPERCHAVVLLVDRQMDEAAQGPWGEFLDGLVRDVESLHRASLLYPIALDEGVFSIHPTLSELNFIRCYPWGLGPEETRNRLASELTHELCRLIAPWVAAVESGGALPPVVDQPPLPVKVFISHSKQDGEPLAIQVRNLLAGSRLKSFFDVYDIPPGWKFEDVIKNEVRSSGLLVVQTDSYAAREFCRMEVLAARRYRVPVVVLNAVDDREPRAFPYVGNVPVIMGRDRSDARLWMAVDALLDEFLMHLFWRLHRRFFQDLAPGALVLPHCPDLLSLIYEAPRPAVVVHPEPPLGNSESELLRQLVPGLRLETPTSLYAQRVRA